MSRPKTEHKVFIINEEGQTPFVEPKRMAVGPGDNVLFVVAGEKDKFTVCPNSDIFRSIAAGEEIHVGPGSPPKATIRHDAELNSVHRYDVRSSGKETIDPILVVHEG